MNNELKIKNSDILKLQGKNKEFQAEKSKLTVEKKSLENVISNISNQSVQSLESDNYENNNYNDGEKIIDIPTSTSYSSDRGSAVVVYKPNSCSYFILENNSGYIVAEWMGGNDPSVGDRVTGNFHSYGTKDFYNQSNDRSSRLWIDDYMLSKDRASEKIRDKCD